MAKKAKKEIIVDPIVFDEDLLGETVIPLSVVEEQPSVEKPKNKVLLGYHPITGAEVWQ